MKKKIIISSAIGFGVISLIVILDKNRKQEGIILNQQHTIDGLIREVQNLSYHLGKQQKIK